MNLFKRSAFCALLIGFATSGAFGQISNINSAAIQPRQFNDIPAALLTVVSNYPSLISFAESNVSKATGFANRDVWRFSTNSGVSAYQFSNNDFFTVFMDVTLTASPTSPRKEAGFLLNSIGGDGQFIVNSDAHEVVAFGGPFPFYAFPATFDSGETIRLGMTYFLNTNGNRAIIYYAGCLKSPVLEFSNLEHGIIDGSTLGGYLQIVNAPTIPTNSATAAFADIHIGPTDVDADGVPDALDACPNTPMCTIAGDQGCSIEQLAPCEGPPGGGTWKNHGQYVSTVARAAAHLVQQGAMTEDEASAVVQEAAHSSCGSKK